MITDQPVAASLSNRFLLKALRLEDRELFAAAADRCAGAVGIEQHIGSFAEEEDCHMSKVLEGMFRLVIGDETDEKGDSHAK